MDIDNKVMKSDELAIFKLRSLYQKYGYSQYKMSKFEEYDLYVKNKDFLISDSVITFNDTNGKLMALKPDVTLSIIKNSKDIPGYAQKLYYNENVYRISKGSHTFKEIMQTGLECIGNIDNYNICEVLMLAVKSLEAISEDFILDISHMGVISDIIDGLNLADDDETMILKCIGDKNFHDIKAICTKNNVSDNILNNLSLLVSSYGKPDEVFLNLENMNLSENGKKSLDELKLVCSILCKNGFDGKINLDFSILNDMTYYSGVVFKGYINSIPTSILSGGQYDKLMRKMGRKSGAIGFAVYLDLLERLKKENKKYDVDTILLYDESTDVDTMIKTVKMLSDNQNTVLAERFVPEGMKYRQLLKFNSKGVEIIETNY